MVAALDSTRGRRKHGGIIDEVRDHDGDKLNNIILPLFNVSRRTLLGKLNPYEKKQRIIYITSAGDKFSFAYDKTLLKYNVYTLKKDFCKKNFDFSFKKKYIILH